MEKKLWRANRSKEGIPFKVPVGALVEVVRNYPRRRVLISYQGKLILTYQGCLKKREVENDRGQDHNLQSQGD